MKKEQLIEIIMQNIKRSEYLLLTENYDETYKNLAENIVNEIIKLGLQEKKEREMNK